MRRHGALRLGELEEREAAVRTDVGWLQARHAWLGPTAVGTITATRTGKGPSGDPASAETRDIVLSQALTPARVAALVRGP